MTSRVVCLASIVLLRAGCEIDCVPNNMDHPFSPKMNRVSAG